MLFDGAPLRILLISPQTWNGPQVSKHHYARALAALGHHVDFLDPPRHTGVPGRIEVADAKEEERIRTVGYRTWFPYRLKFVARRVFDCAMRWQARRIVRAIGGAPDVVWDFDSAYQFVDLRTFGAKRRILHLVDAVAPGRTGTKHAELAVMLDEAWLDQIGARGTPHVVVPHGLNPQHLALARRVVAGTQAAPVPAAKVRIGYVGNLLIPAVDRATIETLVAGQPDALFEFVTPQPPEQVADAAVAAWLRSLAGRANCILHTGRGLDFIVNLAARIDIWLLCYDVARDPNAGANAHKMLEYLATGAPVLTSWLKPYEGSGLVWMAPRAGNAGMTALLADLIAALPHERSDARRSERARYAMAHDYARHLATIDDALRKSVA